ncbi:MAG: hypothetical protein AAFY82_02370 [Pseudomonadota bacterium]
MSFPGLKTTPKLASRPRPQYTSGRWDNWDMIVSHKHKFIFIKTKKTSGTSVEVDLNRVLGPDDVATPIMPPVAGHQPQNFAFKKFGFIPKRFANHMPAAKVKKLVGDQVFNDYFVFCIEREPVDKCISYYSMLKKSPDHNKGHDDLTWDAYLELGEFPLDTFRYVGAQGELLVDQILRYETLAEDLKTVGDRLGFEVQLKSKAKAGFRQDVPVSDAQKQFIYDAFASSNTFTGYTL